MTPEQATQIIKEVFNKLGFTSEVVYLNNPSRGHIFTISAPEYAVYIGERDDITRDLIFLLKRIFNKEGVETFRCTIDINGDQSRRDAYIKMKALNAAEEARSLKTDVLLPPMSSYERMIVHSALVDQNDITTESVGEGKNRQVKVKFSTI